MSWANFEITLTCLFCGALFVGVVGLITKPHLAQYLASAFTGFMVGLFVAAVTLLLAQNLLLSWCLQGSFFQFRQVFHRVLPLGWLGGGAVTGALVGILWVQWSGRGRK